MSRRKSSACPIVPAKRLKLQIPDKSNFKGQFQLQTSKKVFYLVPRIPYTVKTSTPTYARTIVVFISTLVLNPLVSTSRDFEKIEVHFSKVPVPYL